MRLDLEAGLGSSRGIGKWKGGRAQIAALGWAKK
jgi:hypothetical protein